MDTVIASLVVLSGLLLRFGIPIVITLLVVVALRKADARWQAEAAQLPPMADVEAPHCWDIKNCPPELLQACPAPTSTISCWQIYRQRNGYLQEKCLTCLVFRQAPIPAHIPS
jgi:hypothetical protein